MEGRAFFGTCCAVPSCAPLDKSTGVRRRRSLRRCRSGKNAIGWGRMYSGQISQDFQTVNNNVDRPRGSHAHQADSARLSDWASKLITCMLDQVEDQWNLQNEALHGRDGAEHSLFHRALLCAKSTRLKAQAGPLLALDRSILSRPLTAVLDIPTTGLEAGKLNRLFSASSPMRMATMYLQTNTIDDYSPRRRDG
jgi:hypothetical protein